MTLNSMFLAPPHDLEPEPRSEGLRHPPDELPCVSCVGPYQLQSREAAGERPENPPRAVPVLDVSGRTITSRIRPIVSTSRCLFLPLTFFAAS
jgi:hypothetical protein